MYVFGGTMQVKTSKDVFYLNQEIFPRIPVPHDNKINSITLEDGFLSFTLETDIDDKDDSIQYYKPGAKGLVIRYHITDTEGLNIYKEKHSPRHLSWLIPPRFIMLDDRRAGKYINKDHSFEYLYHYVGDNTIIIELFSKAEHAIVCLEAYADYIEYEWIF